MDNKEIEDRMTELLIGYMLQDNKDEAVKKLMAKIVSLEAGLEASEKSRQRMESVLSRCTEHLGKSDYILSSGCNGLMVVDQHLENILSERTMMESQDFGKKALAYFQRTNHAMRVFKKFIEDYEGEGFNPLDMLAFHEEVKEWISETTDTYRNHANPNGETAEYRLKLAEAKAEAE